MEYGCATTNKFSFLDDNEVEDPSVLLAQVNLTQAKNETEAKKQAAAAAKATAAKDAQTKGLKSTPFNKSKIGGKDVKKPLQDNRGQNRSQNNQGGDDIKKPFGDKKRAPRDGDKENTTKRTFGDRPQGDRPQGDRPPRRFNNDRPPRPRHDQDGNPIAEGENRERRQQGGFRGGRGGGGGFRRHDSGTGRPRRTTDNEHREFDRHSGNDKTGIKAVDKKDGAGKGNWGTANDELEEQLQGNHDKSLNQETQHGDGDQSNWADRVDKNEEQTETDESKEAQVNFMTLDQYKALKKKVAENNQFNTRRPGEGEDPKRWANTTLMPKKPVIKDDDEEEEDESEEEDEEEQRKKKVLEQIQIKFSDNGRQQADDRRDNRGPRRDGPRRDAPRREQRGSESDKPADHGEVEPRQERQERPQRDQRGGHRGGSRGGSRGGARGGQTGGFRGPKANMPRIEDEKDFPTLGK